MLRLSCLLQIEEKIAHLERNFKITENQAREVLHVSILPEAVSAGRHFKFTSLPVELLL